MHLHGSIGSFTATSPVLGGWNIYLGLALGVLQCYTGQQDGGGVIFAAAYQVEKWPEAKINTPCWNDDYDHDLSVVVDV